MSLWSRSDTERPGLPPGPSISISRTGPPVHSQRMHRSEASAATLANWPAIRHDPRGASLAFAGTKQGLTSALFGGDCASVRGNEARLHLSLERSSPILRPVCSPAQGKVVTKGYVGGLHHCYTRGIASLHRSCPAWSAEELCAMPGIWPSSIATGIPDHSGHAPIMTGDPTVKPAKPFLLARMTFSTGTGPAANAVTVHPPRHRAVQVVSRMLSALANLLMAPRPSSVLPRNGTFPRRAPVVSFCGPRHARHSWPWLPLAPRLESITHSQQGQEKRGAYFRPMTPCRPRRPTDQRAMRVQWAACRRVPYFPVVSQTTRKPTLKTGMWGR